MPRPFSVAGRGDVVDRLAGRTYDVLVIGGGITGAGVALDAVTRGLRVALVERDDLASGTSSRSTGLVHGGLRYLAHRDVGVVRESLSERSLLVRLAPHLVRPLRFVITREGRRDAALLGTGLTLYDTLAAGRGGRHRRLSPPELLADVPGLAHGTGGGWRYADCRTDDARLVMTVARTAHRLGADILTRAEVVDLRQVAGRVVGAVVHDRLGGGHVEVAARTTVSATGVWADTVRSLAGSEAMLRPSKGVHLVFDAATLRTNAAVLLPSAAGDGRSVFCIPWDDQVVVGTTDDAYDGPLDRPVVEAADATYICDTVNAAFGLAVGPADAIGAWAGLRPLLHVAGRDVDALSRRHGIVEAPDGLLTITGGKLTTYRRMAAAVVDRLTATPARTAHVPLGFRGRVHDAVCRIRLVCQAAGVDPAVAEGLVGRHGDDAAAVVALAAATGEARPLVPGLDYLAAEARWAVREELAITLEDVLDRRLRVANRHPAAGGPAVERVAGLLGSELGLPGDPAAYRARVAAERGVIPLTGG